MHDDLEKIDLLQDKAMELILPSMQDRWEIRSGTQQQVELMLQAKGDIIRSLEKLDKVKGLFPTI